ncbi:MAG TPA: sigma-54 dependent transcriptional regulator [Terracidiphilus sp.]|nr:sigma-54 dependent transcriptional regulator [Terracidiphilus sp.]
MIRIGLFSVDSTLQSHLVSSLGREFEIHAVGTEEKALNLIQAAGCDVLLIDLSSDALFIKKRIEIASRLVKEAVSAVVLADNSLQNAAQELVRLGAFGSCRRPVATRELRTLLERGSEETLLKRELHAAHLKTQDEAGTDRLIGSSPAIRQVYQLIHRVANLNATVLINGESGTGKELIARAIHKLGMRAGKPFVAVSCGAIPETLIEAELFGHEKGAFTGTVGAREGYFEQAADGTLFLDEIGDLSLYTQVKLLRVLQQMEFSRLGSTRLIPLRARLIFATHQDLGKLVEEGKFRQDLYYRINVMRIVSPALVEHAEDIPQIASHYLKHYAKLFEKPMDAISPEAMVLLQNYTWPGNVRELENTVQRAIILAPGTVIRPEDLPLHLHGDKIVEISDYNPDGSFERLLRDYKIKLAVDAVRECNGNKTLAARSLGISRAYLHRLIRLADPDVAEEQESTRNADNDSASA